MKPLSGITVVDFSRVLAAPLSTQILAELGADVIKIERPGSGDETRQFEPKYPEGESGYFFAFNRGKRSITLDLKHPEGQRIARELVAEADVVVENFLPGTMDRMGLGYERLSEINPDLIYLATTGFGQSGPNRDVRGYDTIFQALSGIMAMTGHPDGPPAKVGVPVADLTSGYWAAIGVLTGLVGRQREGRGCYIDLSMMDVQLNLHALNAGRVFALDEDPQRTGTEHPGRVPSAAFETADGGWIHISGSDQHWRPLCEALDLHALAADESLHRNLGRVADRERVMAELRTALAGVPQQEALDRLAAAGVPVGAVRTVREALQDPQSTERDMVQDFAHPQEGRISALRNPLRLAGWEQPDVQTPPMLGQHTHEVLSEVLGIDEAGIERLRSEGVI